MYNWFVRKLFKYRKLARCEVSHTAWIWIKSFCSIETLLFEKLKKSDHSEFRKSWRKGGKGKTEESGNSERNNFVQLFWMDCKIVTTRMAVNLRLAAATYARQPANSLVSFTDSFHCATYNPHALSLRQCKTPLSLVANHAEHRKYVHHEFGRQSGSHKVFYFFFL